MDLILVSFLYIRVYYTDEQIRNMARVLLGISGASEDDFNDRLSCYDSGGCSMMR